MIAHFDRKLEEYVPDSATIKVAPDGTRFATQEIGYSRWHGKHTTLTIEGEMYRFYRAWPDGSVVEVGHTGLQMDPTMAKAEQIRALAAL